MIPSCIMISNSCWGHTEMVRCHKSGLNPNWWAIGFNMICNIIFNRFNWCANIHECWEIWQQEDMELILSLEPMDGLGEYVGH